MDRTTVDSKGSLSLSVLPATVKQLSLHTDNLVTASGHLEKMAQSSGHVGRNKQKTAHRPVAPEARCINWHSIAVHLHWKQWQV